MDRKEKRKIVGGSIDISKNRFKEEELDRLLGLVLNPKENDGLTKTIRKTKTDFSHDGKYTRDIERTFTLRSDNHGVRVEEHYEHHDDDGGSAKEDHVYTKGREILNLLHYFKK